MKKRILLVEDNADHRLIERTSLEAEGFEVLEAGTAKKGIELALKEVPDLILMDIRLPYKAKGIGAAKILRKDRRTRALRQRYLGDDDAVLVGIAWSSNNAKLGRHKSMPLSALQPLLGVPGVRLIDLQYGDTAVERQAFIDATGTPLIHDDSIDQMTEQLRLHQLNRIDAIFAQAMPEIFIPADH